MPFFSSSSRKESRENISSRDTEEYREEVIEVSDEDEEESKRKRNFLDVEELERRIDKLDRLHILITREKQKLLKQINKGDRRAKVKTTKEQLIRHHQNHWKLRAAFFNSKYLCASPKRNWQKLAQQDDAADQILVLLKQADQYIEAKRLEEERNSKAVNTEAMGEEESKSHNPNTDVDQSGSGIEADHASTSQPSHGDMENNEEDEVTLESKRLEIELQRKEREKAKLELQQRQRRELQEKTHEIQKLREQLQLSKIEEASSAGSSKKTVTFPAANEFDAFSSSNFIPQTSISQLDRSYDSNPHYSFSQMGNISSIWDSQQPPIGTRYGATHPSDRQSVPNNLERCLPKWKLSEFSGDPLEWPEWSGLFQATIGRSQISKDEKMNHLKSLLAGKAKNAVSGLGFSGDMYDVAWNTLKSTFGKPHLIVGTQLSKLQQFPSIKMHDSSAIVGYSTVVSNFVNILQQFKYDSDLHSSTNLRIAVQKLPNNLKEQWMNHVDDCDEMPSLIDFKQWLCKKARIHDDLLSTNQLQSGSSKPGNLNNRHGGFISTTSDKQKTFKNCANCGEKHAIWTCKVFKDLSIDKRFDIVKEKRLCFLCLRDDHTVKECKLKKCGVNGCEKRHNRLLHREAQGPPAVKDRNGEKVNEEKTTFASNSKEKSGLLQLVPVKLMIGNRVLETLALCDTGSTLSWIDSSLFRSAEIQGEKHSLVVTGINGSSEIETKLLKLEVTAVADESCPEFTIKAAVHPNLHVGSSTYDIWELKRNYPHLACVPSSIQRLSDVKMILGQDNFSLIRPIAYKDGGLDEPWAIKTVLGWTVGGPLPKKVVSNISSTFTAAQDPIAEQLKNWWDIEAYGSKVKVDNRSADDRRALATLEKTTKLVNGHYEVGLLWAKDDVQLPNNYASAASQMYGLEKRLDKDPQLKTAYKKTIETDLANGHVRKLDREEIAATKDEGQWYLPHHPVLNPNKPGKVRRVCNAASVYQGKSLNSELLIGPDLLQNLIGITFRFREFKVAISADIEAMFLQVRVPEPDARYLRFLWRDSSEEQLKVLEYTSHIFGAKSSPTCANFALLRTATDNAVDHPLAAKAVRRNFYMDDCLSGKETVTEAILLVKQLRELLARGGFTLRKWLSNSKELMDSLPKDDIAETNVKELKTDVLTTTVLGLEWFPDEDKLKLCRGLQKSLPEKITQRVVLSFVSSLFDPLGLAAPFSIRVRMLLKKIWQNCGQKWDEEVNSDDGDTFRLWYNDLPVINELQLERYYFGSTHNKLELHIFADASQDAMGVVAYIKACLNDGTGYLKFVIGKSRVAPMRHLTIPKLELQAAVIGTRIKDSIEKEHESTFGSVHLWSDSTTVIQWINTSFKKQPVFVANRVAEILESTTVDQWKHIPGKDNPADIGTRGISAKELVESEWLTGPAWLREPPDRWPVREAPLPIEASEETSLMVKPMEPILEWERFSKWVRLRNCIKFVRSMFTRDNTVGSETEKLDMAEKSIWKLVQRDVFVDEILRLKNNHELSPKSKIIALTPFIDEEGILRAQGRLRKAKIEYASKHPIILTAHHPAVKIFLRYMHERHQHEGVEYIRSQVQQKFWIIGLRNSLRHIKQQCVQCRKGYAKVTEPMMADLPTSRLADRLFPFTYCGIDYFGPIETKQYRKSNKRWCFLFTCMTTRAVHLEMVISMDTDSCINGIMRFIARKGKPKVIVSDNGTNFVGAAKEIKQFVSQWNADNIEGRLAQEEIEWRFNPPAAPHFGGSWERMVQSCKKAMYNVLQGQRLTDEVLMTTLCAVEQTLNARPTTPVSSDVTDLEALTPYHFLLGRPNVSVPYIPNATTYLSHRKSFRVSQAVAEHIWQRWLKEYIPLYNERSKWRTSATRQLKPSDLVWIIDNGSKRGDYRLARVIETHAGDDGTVRSAKVRTATGDITRPIVKLSPVLDECVPLMKEHRAGDVQAS